MIRDEDFILDRLTLPSRGGKMLHVMWKPEESENLCFFQQVGFNSEAVTRSSPLYYKGADSSGN